AKDIEPIFKETCYECHGPEKQKGGLRLDQKAAALKGGDSGPLFNIGKSAESLVIKAVTGTQPDVDRMPKKKDPLTTEQLALLRAWIDQGADWPDSLAGKGKDWREHWAFKAPVRPKLPETKNARWVKNPID